MLKFSIQFLSHASYISNAQSHVYLAATILDSAKTISLITNSFNGECWQEFCPFPEAVTMLMRKSSCCKSLMKEDTHQRVIYV